MTGATLVRSDFVRAPLLATARPAGYKEWHHFVVHRPGWRLLVNLSLTGDPLTHRLVPRVIVILDDGRWAGAVERFDPDALTVSPDLCAMAVDRNRVSIGPDGYRVEIDLPGRGIRGELHLVPCSRPFVINNQPIASGRLSWLFVPRLRATGWWHSGGVDVAVDGDVAYHDHNWGRFRWGDDFGWESGSMLPTDARDPWSFVMVRMTDRSRLRSFSHALYVWRHDEPAAMFRDAAVRVRAAGLLGTPPDCTLPPPMRLVLAGTATDVPATWVFTGERAGDTVRVEFRPEAYARVALPSEVAIDRSVVLAETSGRAHVTGTISGEALDVGGSGVMELLHG